jgi:general secretion pathway protein E
VEDQLSAKRLLSTLEKKGLISFQQARDLYANRLELVKQFDRRRAKQGGGAASENRNNPFLIFDAIVALNLKRKDDPSKTLDEDTIFQTLAEAGAFLLSKSIP